MTLALLLALPAMTAFGEKVDLRGPAPKAGETIIDTIISETEPGTLNMSVQGQILAGQMQVDSENVIEQTILEVEDSEVTKVQSKYVKAKSITKTTMFGQAQEQEDTNIQGTVLTQTKTADGEWKTETKGGNLPPEASDLIKNASYIDQRVAFPDKPIGVGDTWKVEDELMQAFIGQSGIPGAEFDGETNFEMVELNKDDGKLIAVIDIKVDGTITMNLSPDPNTNIDMTIKIKGEGKIYRDLQNYTTAQDFEGDMDMTMEMTAGGQQAMQMTATMPMAVKQTQERK